MNSVVSLMMGSTKVLMVAFEASGVGLLAIHSVGKCFGWANVMWGWWVAVDR